ncbi:hypothetical protein V6N13_014501 [Hibiscus sabdariffa]
MVMFSNLLGSSTRLLGEEVLLFASSFFIVFCTLYPKSDSVISSSNLFGDHISISERGGILSAAISWAPSLPIGEYCGIWGGGRGEPFRNGGGHGGGAMHSGLGKVFEGIRGRNRLSTSPNEESESLEGVSLRNVEGLELFGVVVVGEDEIKEKHA